MTRARALTAGVHLGALALVTAVACSALDLRGAAPSTTLTAVSAVVLLLAPLLWRPTDRAGDLLGWCLGSVVVALVVALIRAPSPAFELARTGILLFTLLATVHAPLWFLTAKGAAVPAELARGVLVTALAALGSLPVWLGPLVAAHGGESPLGGWALLGSPLIHLATAADADLLRTPWFYGHTALGSMRFEYPDYVATAVCDGALGVSTWTALTWAARRPATRSLIQTPQECHR